ncbi:hypothetical protein TVAG_463540 [Trichomonas vaginalis G3]|uniref:Uncharacterized protein n=1 Tax=Trichomonas vaginalis (strain ATCC PRA-98 / G3) TaxID=412133 RepID=A2EH26_TRIV3|nr:hypothetical protein TVAGG3_0077730 [Trichomonas vaginalis G3]EAY08074.1 hypothetical protein TVAG_463540 [Trichomonas vaginalis G3]KAI5543009.1 hypothetical protein TVAGG3_0077730 [Trichomonas vaginalis G3]|eukprot:XP_001320297.1 hypothetical protein [Trichomonas vaginalis G3]
MFHLFVHHLSSTEENHNQSFGITTNFASDIKLSQENQQKDILTKIKQNEEESYDVTIPSYSSEHSTLHFTNNEVKSIKISSSTYRITIVIFQNANKFTLEDGEQLKVVYSFIKGNEIILKIKALEPNSDLQYYWRELDYSTDMHANVIINVKNFSYGFPPLRNSHLIYIYSSDATLQHKCFISESSRYYGTSNAEFEDDEINGIYFGQVELKSDLPDDEISGIFNVENCLSAFDYAEKIEFFILQHSIL